MRMWMIGPNLMCRKHLLGEHVECHMFLGAIKKGINIDGYINSGLCEIHNLKKRHDRLEDEMRKRGYKTNSPLDFTIREYFDCDRLGKVNTTKSILDLYNRCEVCKDLITQKLPFHFKDSMFYEIMNKFRDSLEVIIKNTVDMDLYFYTQQEVIEHIMDVIIDDIDEDIWESILESMWEMIPD